MLATKANVYVLRTCQNELAVEVHFDEGRLGFVFRKTRFRRRWVGDTWYILFKSGFSTSGWLRHKESGSICDALLRNFPQADI